MKINLRELRKNIKVLNSGEVIEVTKYGEVIGIYTPIGVKEIENKPETVVQIEIPKEIESPPKRKIDIAREILREAEEKAKHLGLERTNEVDTTGKRIIWENGDAIEITFNHLLKYYPEDKALKKWASLDKPRL